MKVNFNYPFLSYNGKEVIQDGKPQLVKEVIAQILFSGEWIEKKENRGKFLLMAYDLSQRIIKSTGEIEITVEEASLIKEGAEALVTSAGGYAQIVNLIER